MLGARNPMTMEPGAGRRSSDRDIDPNVEMYVQEVVADTRHRLMGEIATLAASQAQAALQSTREHAEVKGAIQGMRADLSSLTVVVGELTPLRESVSALKHRDEMDDARQETAQKMLVELQKQRAQFRTFMIALAGLVVAAVGVVVAVIH